MRLSSGKYKFHLILFALTSLVLTPLTATVLNIHQGVVGLINFTFLICIGFTTAIHKLPKLLTIIIGTITLMSAWTEFFMPAESMCSYVRMMASFLFFVILAFILIRNFIKAKEIHLDIILGAMAGFILLGLIGGVAFEIMETLNPGSFLLVSKINDYDFYYFSFISLLTVGYGDIVSLSAATKSLSILISLVGQFYMTIGIALFVGKYLNQTITE